MSVLTVLPGWVQADLRPLDDLHNTVCNTLCVQHRCRADRGKGLATRDYKLTCPMACVGGYAPMASHKCRGWR